MDVPLLPSIDQWGYVPFPLRRLTPHSLSRLIQQMLAGDFVAHRRIPIDDDAVTSFADPLLTTTLTAQWDPATRTWIEEPVPGPLD